MPCHKAVSNGCEETLGAGMRGWLRSTLNHRTMAIISNASMGRLAALIDPVKALQTE
jgi:hypothetical protein